MNTSFALAAFAACFALSACGGGSGSTSGGGTSGGGTSTTGQAVDAQKVDTTYTDLQDRITSGALTATSPTGQASMAGYMGISGVDPTDTTTTVLGKLAMDVDFDAGTVAGKASDFGVYKGTNLQTKVDTVTGSLGVAGTVTGSDLAANATGTMADSSKSPTDFNLNMTGKFYDDKGTLTTVGDLAGTMNEGTTTTNVDGAFFATKN